MLVKLTPVQCAGWRGAEGHLAPEPL